MGKLLPIFLLLATSHHALGQAGGWYVVNESLVCTATCEPLQGCNIIGAPDDATIAEACKQITDDCADGTLSNGQRAFLYGAAGGVLGTSNFGTGSAHGNNGCPNNNDCNLSYKYLVGNMRYASSLGAPNTYCSTAYITINGHYNHLKTGNIIVQLPTIRRHPPKRSIEDNKV